MAKRNWGVVDRRPLKVNVKADEKADKKTEVSDVEQPNESDVVEPETFEDSEKEVELESETQGSTVVENEISNEETIEVVNTPVEEKTVEKSTGTKKPGKEEIKEWTEEELAVLSREKFAEVEADIRAGKAKVLPRKIKP